MNSVLQMPDKLLESEDNRAYSLTVEVIENENEFLALHPVWDDLVEKSSGDIFQTFDWLSHWWKYYGVHPTRSLHILVIRNESIIAGICPLFLEVEKLFGFSLKRRLRMMGSVVSGEESSSILSGIGPSDYLDVILHPEYRADAVRMIVEYFKRWNECFDEIELHNLPERSAFPDLLLAELRRRKIDYRMQQADICPRMTIPPDVDSFLRKLKPEIRRRINQVQRAAKDLYAVKTVQTQEELNAALYNLIRLHQKRWNQLGYPGLFADHRFKLFQENVLQSFFGQGRIWCKTVEMNGACIAVRIGFKFNATLYDFLSGFDYDSPGSKRRPGIALLFSMIEDGISCGIQTLDFLRGDEDYKFDFADSVARNSHIVICNGRKRSMVLVTLSHAVGIVKLLMAAFSKEWVLFKIQYQVHGGARCLARYFAFRTERMRNKFIKASSSLRKA